MNFNVNEIKIIDLNGDIQPVELGKALGNMIYSYSRTLDWLEVSKSIHKSEPVELGESDLIALKNLISENYVTLLLMVKVAIIEYIDELLTTKNT